MAPTYFESWPFGHPSKTHGRVFCEASNIQVFNQGGGQLKLIAGVLGQLKLIAGVLLIASSDHCARAFMHHDLNLS